MGSSDLLEKAARQGGVAVRGTASFQPALDMLLPELMASKTLTPDGRERVEAYIVDTLIARFKIEDWIARHPEVGEAPVERPLFILGMPRAGTTLLLNLLRFDPQRRVYWHWEGNRETPPVAQAELYSDARIVQRVEEVNAGLASGALDPRHHLEMGDEPTECLWTLAQDFKAYPWLVQSQVPAYFEWLYHKADMVAAYRHHKHALQVMQSRAPGRWTLKFPSHGAFLDALLKVYPDARIMVTHRDPVKPIGSTCSVCEHILMNNNARIDRAYLGYESSTLIAHAAIRVMAARDAHPDVPFFDMHYKTFVANPIAEIVRLYDFLGEALPHDVLHRMEVALAGYRSQRAVHGEHAYKLEDYGLSRKGVEVQFKDYIARFGIAPETD